MTNSNTTRGLATRRVFFVSEAIGWLGTNVVFERSSPRSFPSTLDAAQANRYDQVLSRVLPASGDRGKAGPAVTGNGRPDGDREEDHEKDRQGDHMDREFYTRTETIHRQLLQLRDSL